MSAAQHVAENSVRRAARIILVTMAVAVILAVLESSVVYVGNALRPGTHDRFVWVLRLTLLPWIILGALGAIAVIVAERIPFRRGGVLKVVGLHSVIACVFASAHLVGIALLMTPWTGAMMRARIAELFVNYFVADVMIYWALVGTVQALLHYREAQRRTVQASQLRSSLSEARLLALRAQLQPHFLFNALNTVSMLVRAGDASTATNALAELGALLRALIYDEVGHEVPLETELRLVLRYLAIEQLRFGPRLTVSTAIAGCERALVPSFILQPLAENALRHGLAHSAQAGRVELTARQDAGALVLEVRNTSSAPHAAGAPGIGLRVTEERLRQRYGDRYALELVHEAAHTVARIRLPLLVQQGDERAEERRGGALALGGRF